MKIIMVPIVLLACTSLLFSQSVMDYQTGTTIVVGAGADLCADRVIINGTYSGEGTICGATLYVFNLTALIEGFYNSSSNTMIGDTVRVYLRNAVSPYAIVDSSKAVLNSSGNAAFYFSNAVNGTDYYLVIRHRNSIETWSSSPVSFSSGILAYDFTTAASKAYGNNQIQVDNAPVKFAIFSGDVNQDGIVDAADLSLVDNAAFNSVSGYVVTDVNGDNFVDASDLSIDDNNVFNGIIMITPSEPEGARR